MVSEAAGHTNQDTDQGTYSGHPEQTVKASRTDQGSKDHNCGQSAKTNSLNRCSSDSRSLVPNVSTVDCCSPPPPPKVETTLSTGASSLMATAVNTKDSAAFSSVSAVPTFTNQVDTERRVHLSVQPTRRETISTWQSTEAMSRIAGSSKVVQNCTSYVDSERPSRFVDQPVVTLSCKESLSRPSGLPGSQNPDGHMGLDASNHAKTASLSSSTQGEHLLEIPSVASSSTHPLCTPPLYPTECAPRLPHWSLPFQLPSLSSFQSSKAQRLGLLHHSRNDNVSLSTATPLYLSSSTHFQALAESATPEKDTPCFPREPSQSLKEAIPPTYTSSNKTVYPLSPPDLSMSISSVPAERQGAAGFQTLPTLEDLQVSMERMSLMAKTVLQDIQREKESLSKHQQRGALDPGAAPAHDKTLFQQSCAQDGLVPSTAPCKSTIPSSAFGAAATNNDAFNSDKVCKHIVAEKVLRS